FLGNSPFDYDLGKGEFYSTHALFDLPAILIALIITAVLVKGIRESASFNAGMVIVKLAIVFLVIGVGAFYIRPENWTPFAPMGYYGVSFFVTRFWARRRQVGNRWECWPGRRSSFLPTLALTPFRPTPKRQRIPNVTFPSGSSFP